MSDDKVPTLTLIEGTGLSYVYHCGECEGVNFQLWATGEVYCSHCLEQAEMLMVMEKPDGSEND